MYDSERGIPEEYTGEQELAKEDIERSRRLLVKVEALIKSKDYIALQELVSGLDEGDPLVTKGDFLAQLHELSYKKTKWRGDREYPSIEETDAGFDAFALLVEKMGNNPNNIAYLKRIFYEDRVPKAVHSAIVDWMNTGAEPDEYRSANYFRHVARALGKINTDESVRAVEQMLVDIIEKNQRYLEEHYGLVEISQEDDKQKDSEEDDWYYSDYDERMDLLERGYGKGAMHDLAAGYSSSRFKASVIEVLNQCGRKSSVEAIINYIKADKEDALVVFQSILETLRKIDQNEAAIRLLDMARVGDEQDKRSALWLLYRLESGRVGISEKGVQYLQKVYDVGKYNNSDFYTQRITSRGEVGIFEKSSDRFQQYFRLEGLEKKEQLIKAQLLDLTYATLFTPRSNETPSEKKEREKFLQEFQEKYFQFFTAEFFNQAGVRFNDLSFQEQAQFIRFYESADETQKQRVIDFCKNYGHKGFTAFLSLDYGIEMGETILSIGGKLKRQTANRIFSKYFEIVTATEFVESYLVDKFSKQASAEIVDRVKESLMRRGKDLLVEFKDMDEKDVPDVVRKLENIKTEVIIFASTLREMAKDSNFSVQEFVEKSIEIRNSTELSADDKKQMIQVFVANRPEFSPELLKSDLEEFKHYMDETGHEFRLLKQDGNVIAFIRFDHLPGNRIYAGSFNLSPDARGTSIAIAMAKTALEEFGANHEVEADCYSKNKSLLLFYKRMLGFKEVGKTDEGDPEKELVKLIRPKALRQGEQRTAA